MAEIISGKDLSLEIKDNLKNSLEDIIKKYGRAPHLVVVLVGNNPASLSYVTGKEKASNYIGIKNTTLKLSEDTSEEELLNLIDKLNNDDSVDGILVQLPLPKQINEEKVIDRISVMKDVDGFHPTNVSNLWLKKACTYPCTPKGIMKLLEKANVEIAGKKALVLGRSNIVGLPISKLLLDANATVTIAHSKTKNLQELTKEADIIIAAIGKPRFLTGDMVKDGVVIIDVGINRTSEGKLCGDVDFDSCEPKASVITKVPGGVGPMTIACLMENTFECFLRKQK